MLCFVQVSQNSVDDFLVLYTGDDPDRSAATLTDLDIDADGRPVKTRFRRCAQVMAAWRSAGARTSALEMDLAPLPRLTGVTSPR